MNLPLPIRIVLWPLSLVYGAFARLRAWLYVKGWKKQKRLRGKVVSVGNLTVGGTGKTPMVIWLAKRFAVEGKQVAILTRGYGAKDGISDEVEVMRSKIGDQVRFGIGANRFEAGSQIEADTPVDVFLLDDGYQHLELARDVNILLIDTSRPLRTEKLLPSGRLREPKSASARADLVVFTRTADQMSVKKAIQEFPNMPIFPSTTVLKGYSLLSPGKMDGGRALPLPPQPTFAFCGIGNPDAFFADLDRWGNVVAGRKAFRDHHRYSPRDIEEIEKEAMRISARSIVTTAKDAANLLPHKFEQLPAYSCEIELIIGDESEFWTALKSKLGSVQNHR
jgi:tetraacyldisaccharide 4'-kinase